MILENISSDICAAICIAMHISNGYVPITCNVYILWKVCYAENDNAAVRSAYAVFAIYMLMLFQYMKYMYNRVESLKNVKVIPFITWKRLQKLKQIIRKSFVIDILNKNLSEQKSVSFLFQAATKIVSKLIVN